MVSTVTYKSFSEKDTLLQLGINIYDTKKMLPERLEIKANYSCDLFFSSVVKEVDS